MPYLCITSQNNFSTPAQFVKITKYGPDKTNSNQRHDTDSTTQQAHIQAIHTIYVMQGYARSSTQVCLINPNAEFSLKDDIW